MLGAVNVTGYYAMITWEESKNQNNHQFSLKGYNALYEGTFGLIGMISETSVSISMRPCTLVLNSYRFSHQR